VPENFNGYFEVYGPQGPDVRDPTFVRTMVFFPTREILRGGKGRGIFSFNAAGLNGLAQLANGSFSDDDDTGPDDTEPGTGLAVLTALDCQGTLAAKTTYNIETPASQTDGVTQGFYTLMQLPNPDTTETDTSGTGGYTNLNPGPVLFSSTNNALGRRTTPDSGAPAFIRAGWYTQVYVSP
jgi:hypothetical protein